MKFEIVVPPADPDDFAMTLRVEAASWMAALKAGIARLELGFDVKHVTVDVRADESVLVTESTSGRTFVIQAAKVQPPAVNVAPGEHAPPPVVPEKWEDHSPRTAAPHGQARPTPSAQERWALAELGRKQTEAEQQARRTAAQQQAEAERQAEAQRQAEFLRHAEVQRQAELLRHAERQAELLRQAERQAELLRQAERQAELLRQAERQAELLLQAERQAELLLQAERQAELLLQAERQAELLRQAERQAEAKRKAEHIHQAEAERALKAAHKEAEAELPEPPSAPRGRLLEQRLVRAFHRAASAQNAASTPSEAANAFLDIALEIIPAEAGAFLFADIAQKDMFIALARGAKSQRLLNTRIPFGAGICGHAVLYGLGLAVNDVSHDFRSDPAVNEALGTHPSAILCAPVQKNGRTFGALQLVNALGTTRFADTELVVLDYLATHLAEFLERHYLGAA